MSNYNKTTFSKKVKFDGYIFDSKIEFEQYLIYKSMMRAGHIKKIEVHPRYELLPSIYISAETLKIYTGDKRNRQDLLIQKKSFFKPDFRIQYCEEFKGEEPKISISDKKAWDKKLGKFRLSKEFQLKVKLMKLIYNIDVEVI